MSASKPKQALWMVAGYFILIPFCLARCWEPCESTINPFGRAPRTISRWKTPWPAVTKFLNDKYGNREDGLGPEALIWNDRGERVLYRPTTWAPLRAWLWSAWRNSTNELSR